MKKPPPGTEERIAKMTFASVYPLYVAEGNAYQDTHNLIIKKITFCLADIS